MTWVKTVVRQWAYKCSVKKKTVECHGKYRCFPGGSVVKNPPADAGVGVGGVLILGSGRSSGERSGNPLQYSCLENPMDRGAWELQSLDLQKSRTQISD